jgi:hypothetical protein
MKKESIKGFKGFNPDMTCRDFQYKEGETYKHEGRVKACSSGFHFCENPLDVFGYYPPGESVYSTVEGNGKVSRDSDDSKVAVSELTVGAKIELPDFIGACVSFMFSRKYREETSTHTDKDSSASSATGDSSASVCTGGGSKAMAGKFGCIALAWWNDTDDRWEMRCAETGVGDGSDGKLKAEVWYRIDDKGNFIEA